METALNKSKVIEYGRIAEMAQAEGDLRINIPLAEGVDLAKLTEGDDDPLFVTIDALTTTISTNKRRWTIDELNSVARQIIEKKPDGYLGHLTEAERATKHPEAVTIWIGAKVIKYRGKERLFIKGYVLPKADSFRDYLRRAKNAGKKIAVSVYGQAIQIWNDAIKAYDMRGFTLESIDWARPGSEGVANSGYLALTAEMSINGEELMDRKEVLESTSVSEMREINPDLVSSVEQEAKAPLETTVSEMRSALEIDDEADLVKTVSEMIQERDDLKEKVAENIVDRELGQKVPSVAARQAVKKLTIQEMKGNFEEEHVFSTIKEVLESDYAKALISEMGAQVVQPGSTDNRNVEPGKGARKWIKR